MAAAAGAAVDCCGLAGTAAAMAVAWQVQELVDL